MNVKANKGVMPASDASGESWDADDTPRLDDYFRGQVQCDAKRGLLWRGYRFPKLTGVRARQHNICFEG